MDQREVDQELRVDPTPRCVWPLNKSASEFRTTSHRLPDGKQGCFCATCGSLEGNVCATPSVRTECPAKDFHGLSLYRGAARRLPLPALLPLGHSNLLPLIFRNGAGDTFCCRPNRNEQPVWPHAHAGPCSRFPSPQTSHSPLQLRLGGTDWLERFKGPNKKCLG